MNYFGRRQNPLHLSDEELSDSFKYIHDYFGTHWLANGGDHPLQVLWSRRDSMATNELYLLADALQNLSVLNPSWVKHQVKLIVGKDKNNRQGAFFELIGLNYLARGTNFQLKPAKAGEAGIDAGLLFQDQHKINLSLKTYGQSSHQQSFEEKAKGFEQLVLRYAREWQFGRFHISIYSVDSYPQAKNWETLRQLLPEVMRRVSGLGRGVFAAPDNSWVIIVFPLEGTHNYHPDFLSYKFHMTSPHHKNEYKNLTDKLDKACANLNKHAAQLSDKNRNVIYIHLPASAPVKKCVKWANTYLMDFPEQPISYILFYQPTISTNPEEDTSHIHHCFVQSRSIPLESALPKPTLTVPVGVVSSEPSTLELHIGDRISTIEEKYIFQSGNLYVRGQKEGNQETFDIRKRASGVFIHAAIDGGGILSGIFPPQDELLIV